MADAGGPRAGVTRGLRRDEGYYECDELFGEDNVKPADAERLRRTAALVPPGIKGVLDVGCGSGEFLDRLRQQRPEIGALCGVDRSRAALGRVRGRRVRAGIDGLPFADRSFELVSALQVLEHLPAQLFERGVAELARVSARYLLVSVPCEERLEDTFVACPRCCSRFSPFSHLRRFGAQELQHLFDGHGFRPQRTEHLGTFQHLIGWTRIRRLAGLERNGGNPYPFALACPVCNHRLPGAGPGASPHDPPEAMDRPPLRRWIRRLWPKQARPVHIAVLFGRCG